MELTQVVRVQIDLQRGAHDVGLRSCIWAMRVQATITICFVGVLQVLGLLQQHQHVVLDETFDSGLVERTEEPDAAQGDVHVWGSLVAFVERLDDELFKSLQVQPPPVAGSIFPTDMGLPVQTCHYSQ